MIFRLSHELNAKIKAGPLATIPAQGNPFVDWSSHLFTAERTQYILLSNTKTLYSTVLYGRGLTDDNRFIRQALNSIRDALKEDDQDEVCRRLIEPASGQVRFARASSRSVTGSMNELIVQAKFRLAEDEMSPFDVGLWLNEVPLSALSAGEVREYATPRAAFKAMVDANGPDGV